MADAQEGKKQTLDPQISVFIAQDAVNVIQFGKTSIWRTLASLTAVFGFLIYNKDLISEEEIAFLRMTFWVFFFFGSIFSILHHVTLLNMISDKRRRLARVYEHWGSEAELLRSGCCEKLPISKRITENDFGDQIVAIGAFSYMAILPVLLWWVWGL